MPIPWGDHLDLARCVAVLGEDDLREATTAMGRCLFHLQRDLLLETWEESTLKPALQGCREWGQPQSYQGIYPS